MLDNVTDDSNFFHLQVNASSLPILPLTVAAVPLGVDLNRDELIRVTVPPGHYSSNTLAVALNKAISKSLQEWIVTVKYWPLLADPAVPVSDEKLIGLYWMTYLQVFIKAFHDENRVSIDPITGKMTIQSLFHIVKKITGSDDYQTTRTETSLPVTSGFVNNIPSILKVRPQTVESWFDVPNEYFLIPHSVFMDIQQQASLNYLPVTLPLRFDAYSEITSVCPVNLSGVTEVLITSSKLAGGRSIGLHTASKTTKADTNVLAVISLAETGRGFTAVLKPEDTELTRIDYNSHRSLADIDIQFRDINGKILSLPDNYNTSILLGITYTTEY